MRRVCGPEQKALYTHPIKTSEDIANKREGYTTILFSKNHRKGVNYINACVKPLARKAGVIKYNDVTGNSIRRYVLTKLANDETITQKEVQEHARHRSATAQNHYITTNENSHIYRQRVMATGFNFLSTKERIHLSNQDCQKLPAVATKNPYLGNKTIVTPTVKVFNPYLRDISNRNSSIAVTNYSTIQKNPYVSPKVQPYATKNPYIITKNPYMR